MTLDDLKKIATGPVLFNLNRIIAPRLTTILYFLGLAAILVWAINHFFLTFSHGFGAGLWGLLEIAVFGLFALIVLRIACEAIIVYFRDKAVVTMADAAPRSSASLIDDVKDAIEELADVEDKDAANPPVI